jgi:kynurenine 3-monooxygenase
LNSDQVFQAYGTSDKDAINSISRGWLNGFLLDELEKSDLVKLNFEKTLKDIDFSEKELRLSDDSKIKYELLIGTDGTASVIREKMQKEHQVQVSSEDLSHAYKEFVLTPTSNNEHKIEKHALHIWPRGDHMIIALPNIDGSFTCTLFIRKMGDNSLDAMTTPAEIEKFFIQHYPDFCKLVPDFVEQHLSHPVGRMTTVKTSRWSPPGFEREVLLIGDSSHAIVPFFGQGMNSGFEDCVELMQNFEHKLETGFAEYAKDRRKNTDAIADMAIENFVEMSAKTADAHFLFQKEIEKQLQIRFPKLYASRYSLVSFSLQPYSVAQKIGLIQKVILDELSEKKTNLSEISWIRAEELIQERITPFMREHNLLN